MLQINDIDVFGTVVWSGGQRFGLQFEEAVPLPQVVGIRHYADSYAENEEMVNRRNARNFVHGRPHLRPSR